ncbi:hypothetical protein G9A89_003888 [Geosiphon pyriformis]|nr:hypothetical protein G9A89_003888 [Geosiphon pyriformis]
MFLWEVEPGHDVIPGVLIEAVDWDATVRLPVVVRKRLYNKLYPSVLCLLCYEVELPDHVFTCFHDIECVRTDYLWSVLVAHHPLLFCNLLVVEILDDKKEAVNAVIGFVGHLVELHHSKVWLVRSVFRIRIEKAGLVGDDSLFSGLFCCLSSLLPDKVVRMLGVAGSFAVKFGHRRSYLFFSGLDSSPNVNIGV